MITIQATADTSQTAALAARLSHTQVRQAISRGINKSLLVGRTEARKAVKSLYNIPQKNLGGIEIKKSYPSFLQGSVNASAKPIPMDAFSPKFSTSANSVTTISRRGVAKTKLKASKKAANYKGGVTIEVKKGERQVVPFAFMLPTMANRVFGRGTYRRGGGSFGFVQRNKREANSNNNDSVKPLISVTVHAAVINPKAERQIADKLNTHFPGSVLHELQVIANGIV